jgi:glycolate oxidase iron-sulfur subunit
MHLTLPEVRRTEPFLLAAKAAIGACVHCGFCNATCPTYTLLGDERDGPRGRIYAIKEMLESAAKPAPDLVPHLDRCLSCLSCRATCPSGVDYARLIDVARTEVAERRRWTRAGLLRRSLAALMTRPHLLRLAVIAGRLADQFRLPLPRVLLAAANIARQANPARGATDGQLVLAPEGARRARVALLLGCVQRAVAPEINEATVSLLRRLGCEVVVMGRATCCGSLDHHLGHEERARRLAGQLVETLRKAQQVAPFDHVVSNLSGCGAHLKDLAFHLQGIDATDDVGAIASRIRDVTEVVDALGFASTGPRGVRVAYHAACSLQHGQRVRETPERLLAAAGYEVMKPKEEHLCCGSAGTYNILQSDLGERLGARKADNLRRTGAEIVATGNVGCILQLRTQLDLPVVHTVELLDWASGGARPLALGPWHMGDA